MQKKKAKRKAEAVTNEWLKWVIGTLIAVFSVSLGYYEWQKDRHAKVRYVDYKQEGEPGKTAVTFSTHYRNIGKTDATELTMESRFFTAKKYSPDLSTAERMEHSWGTLGAGLDFYNVGFSVPLEDSLMMMMPVTDSNLRIWWHERVHYKDEDGKDQPPVDTCLVWDRKYASFIMCPKE